MKQRTAAIGEVVPASLIAAALGLNVAELSFQKLVPTIVKTEVAHAMIPVINREALHRIKTDNNKLVEISKQYSFEGFYCFTINEGINGHMADARFFNPLIGIDEDAATGTAAGPLAGFLVLNKFIELNTVYQIMQGVKLNQPSVIEIMVRDADILVGGASVITMKGKIYL